MTRHADPTEARRANALIAAVSREAEAVGATRVAALFRDQEALVHSVLHAIAEAPGGPSPRSPFLYTLT
jgi:hypothetical protein